MKQLRILLTEEDFKILVSGSALLKHSTTGQEVCIALADIGYAHMVNIIVKAEDKFHEFQPAAEKPGPEKP